METTRKRFQLCDERFHPHLENVLSRLPADIRAGITGRTDIQFVAEDGFRDACMLRRRFPAPAQSLVYLNTKMLGGPEHLILLAIATGIALCFVAEGSEVDQNREAESILRQWGFTEELRAVRYDQQVAGTRSYRAGYDWAMGQSKDYLMTHFGLFLDTGSAEEWGRPPAGKIEEIDLPEGTLSKLQEMVGTQPAAVDAATGDIDPRQAMLAGVMAALHEIRWREQVQAAVCDIRSL